MTQISIEFKNKAKILSMFRRAPTEMTKALNEVLLKTGAMAMGEVKMVITKGTGMWKPPIDTGQMKQGINLRKKSNSIVVSTSPRTDYAVYVHEGTRFMRARPFFDITANKKKTDIEKFANQEMTKAINKIFK